MPVRTQAPRLSPCTPSVALLFLLTALPLAAQEPYDFTLVLRAADVEYHKTEAGGAVSWASRVQGGTHTAKIGYESGGAAAEAALDLLPGKAPPVAGAAASPAGAWTKTPAFLAPRLRVYAPGWKTSFVAELGVAADGVSDADAAWLGGRQARALRFSNKDCPLAPFAAECVPLAWERSPDGAGLVALSLGVRLRKDDAGFRWTTLNGKAYPAKAAAPPPQPAAAPPAAGVAPPPVAQPPVQDLPALVARYIVWTPLSFGGNAHLQGGALIPPLRDAWILPTGGGHVAGGLEIDKNSHDFTAGGVERTLEGRYMEMRLDVRYGLMDRVEGRAGLVSNGWSLSDDFVPPFDPSVSLKGSSFTAASNVELGVKGQAWSEGESAITGCLDVKVPVLGEEDDLTSSEGTDIAVSVQGTTRAGEAMVHAQLGYASLGGDLENAVFYGVGAVYPLSPTLLAVGQIQGNTAVFDDALDAMPIELILGGRWLPAPGWNADGGIGVGLAGDSPDFLIGVRVGTTF